MMVRGVSGLQFLAWPSNGAGVTEKNKSARGFVAPRISGRHTALDTVHCDPQELATAPDHLPRRRYLLPWCDIALQPYELPPNQAPCRQAVRGHHEMGGAGDVPIAYSSLRRDLERPHK
ncbi:hypothetical protein F4824DRAFT_495575 [Ustulina deusta]|nr:hypothetical protein F4824DRAFT_495575 [Ustulina deusta]